ncbi:hypothetical protein F4777DRAFT_236411 [Nemania sp. FL0916]|nr:hypothetical protein F4777DRAFT_236411 [Nemania sp. FL0916]
MMHDEAHESRPRQHIMPFITTPTPTATKGHERSKREDIPLITAAAREPETSQFVLGTDTCGFTSDGAVTCDAGYACSNIDSYRGCCIAGDADCSSTIYTDCLGYAEMPNAAMCGPQTLCCPYTKAYCVTYGFMTSDQPYDLFTHVQCAESPSYGELYPFPPSLTMTSESSSSTTQSSTSDTLSIQPVTSTGSSSSGSSLSSGTIVGAAVGGAVGGVALIFLVIFSIFALIRRRRRQRQRQREGHSRQGSDAPDAPQGVIGKGVPTHTTIDEDLIPPPPAPARASRERRLSVSSLLLRPFAHNWPLGGPSSPRNPLSSHPVGDVEKRLIHEDLVPRSTQHTKPSVPTLQVPASLTPGPHIAPRPRKESMTALKTSTTGVSPTTSTTASGLQSPRLSGNPPLTIDAAMEKGDTDKDKLGSAGDIATVHQARAAGDGATAAEAQAEAETGSSPVSPLALDDGTKIGTAR